MLRGEGHEIVIRIKFFRFLGEERRHHQAIMPEGNQQRLLVFRGLKNDLVIDPNFFAADKNQFHVARNQQRNYFLKQPRVSDFAQQLLEFGFDVVPFEVGLNTEDFPFFSHRD